MSPFNTNSETDTNNTLTKYMNGNNKNGKDDILNSTTTATTINESGTANENPKETIRIVGITTKQNKNNTSIIRIYIEKYISSILIASIVIYLIVRPSDPKEAMHNILHDNEILLSIPKIVITSLVSISGIQYVPMVISTINDLSLKQHILLCALAAITALFILLYSLFTLTTIFSFLGFISLSCMGIYLAINDIKKYGLASYLPSWILEYEYPQSIDEYMRDTTFMNEHRYLLLYFIPGIDLEYAISQLSERRRETLFRKWTIGDILGLGNDNLIETNEEEEQMLLNDQNVIEINNIPNDLEWDEGQEKKNEEVPLEVLTYDNTEATTRSNEETKQMTDPREEEWKYEESVINNALSSFYKNTTTTIIKSITTVLQSYSSMYTTSKLIGNVVCVGMFGSLALFLPRYELKHGNGMRNVSYFGLFASSASLVVRLGFKGFVSYMENQCRDDDRFSSLD